MFHRPHIEDDIEKLIGSMALTLWRRGHRVKALCGVVWPRAYLVYFFPISLGPLTLRRPQWTNAYRLHLKGYSPFFSGSQRPILDLMASHSCPSSNLLDFIPLETYMTLFSGPNG